MLFLTSWVFSSAGQCDACKLNGPLQGTYYYSEQGRMSWHGKVPRSSWCGRGRPQEAWPCYFIFIRTYEPLLEMKVTAVLKKSEKMGLSSVLGTSWSLLLAVLVPPESCDLFRIIQDRALSAFLCVTLVLDIIGWIAFLWTREDGDSLADREMQNRLGCDGLLAAHDFCTRRSPACVACCWGLCT